MESTVNRMQEDHIGAVCGLVGHIGVFMTSSAILPNAGGAFDPPYEFARFLADAPRAN